MNDELFTPEDQRLLDRLVDGELDEVERRALLLRLDSAPQGWRRCALAFLEAQAWRGEVRAAVTEPLPSVPAGTIRPASTLRRAGPILWVPLAMAAGFVLTFVGLRNWNSSQIARVSVPAGGGVQITEGTASATPQNLRLVVDGAAGEPQNVVEVPLVDAQRMDAQRMNEALFGSGLQQLTPEMVRLLEQSGHRVVRERRLMPVELRDGRRVVVPMDQVEIRPVSSQGYQ